MSIPLGVPVAEATSYPSLDPIPVAKPLAEPSPVAVPLTDAQRSALARSGFPSGLVTQLVDSAMQFPVRIFVLDNSGSMQCPDGTRLVSSLRNGKKTFATVASTRWEELADSVASIAELTETLGVRSDFHLLSPSGMPQFSTIPASTKDNLIPTVGKTTSASQLVAQMRRVSPSGGTPLTEAVQQIIAQVQPAAASLRAAGQQVVVTLMTDGLPNDKMSFQAALRQLQSLPVWLVVRLCTDDEAVVSYWDDWTSASRPDWRFLTTRRVRRARCRARTSGSITGRRCTSRGPLCSRTSCSTSSTRNAWSLRR